MKILLSRLFNKELVLAYLCRISGVVLTFILNIVLARIYGIDTSGRYYVVYNFMTIVSSISFLGLGYVIVHYLTPLYSAQKKTNEANRLLSLSIYFLLLMLIVVGYVVYLLRGVLSVYLFDDIKYSKLIVILVLITFPYTGVLFLSEVFKALKKPNESIIVTNVLTNSVFIIFLFLYHKSQDIESVLCLYAIANVISFLGTLIFSFGFFSKKGLRLLYKYDDIFKSSESNFTSLCFLYFKENLMLSVVAISNIVLSVFDTLVISSMLTSTDVALYSVASKVVSFGSIILTTINSLIGFQIADLAHKKEQTALSKVLIKYTRLMFPLAFAYYLFAIIFAAFIPFVFGSDYSGSVGLCYLLAIGQFITIITGPCSYFAIMTGHAKKYSQIVLLSAVISVVTNISFVPLMGIYGSVISSIITLGYKNIHTFLFVKHTNQLRLLDFCFGERKEK